MKKVSGFFPIYKLVSVFLIGTIIYFELRDYPLFTYQKSYFVLINAFLFGLYLYALHAPGLDPLTATGKLRKTHLGLRIFLLALVVVPVCLFAFTVGRSVLRMANQDTISPVYVYKIVCLYTSYQAFGLIKRGLIPSFARLLSSHYVIQLYVAKITGMLLLAIGVASVAFKKKWDGEARRIFILTFLLSPLGLFYQYTFTSGLYDTTMIGLLMIAISLDNRPASIMVDILGMLVHEAYFVLRFPFLVCQLLPIGSAPGEEKKSVGWAWAQFILGLFAFVIMNSNLVRPARSVLENYFFTHYQQLKSITGSGDLVALHPISREGTFLYDMRTIMLPYFHTKDFFSYLIPLFLSVAGMLGMGYRFSNLRGRSRWFDLCMSAFFFVTPLALCLAGADYGRWINFAFVTWTCYYILFRPYLIQGTVLSYSYLSGACLLFLLVSPLGTFQHPLFYTLFG
jgi:hypothetical protein